MKTKDLTTGIILDLKGCFCILSLFFSTQVRNNVFASVVLGLLFMQWTAEAANRSRATSQCGHLVQWWTTAEPKVLQPPTFLLYSLLICLLFERLLQGPKNNFSLPPRSIHTSLRFKPFLHILTFGLI